MIGERRLTALRDFAAELSRSNSEAEVFSAAERSLANAQHDFPFTAVYLGPTEGLICQLVACSGIAAGSSLAPLDIGCGSIDEAWPIAEALNQAGSIVLDDLQSRLGMAPSGPGPRRRNARIILPLIQAGQGRAMGVLSLGSIRS